MENTQDLCEIGELLSGCVESISFRNPENGFSVLELNTGDELITVVGTLPFICEGETLEVRGVYESHPSFGVQFKAIQCERAMPATAAAILRYLSSGAVKGVGPATARRLVEAFGEDTLRILTEEPGRLAKLKGITPAKAARIAEESRRQFGIREVMLSLGQYGITADESMRIFQLLGAAAAEHVTRNPYILCGEELGFSFERADTIAMKLELPLFSPERIRAGILHVLRHNLGNGHTGLPKDKLLAAARALLEDENALCEDMLEEMLYKKQLELLPGQRQLVFLPLLYRAETYIANRLSIMMKYPPQPIHVPDSELRQLEQELGVTYETRQRQAIEAALQQGILILTGGPGTGKTTTLDAVIRLLRRRGQKLAVCAPTGRAAKRITELTGEEAKTIHRLLEVEWGMGHRAVFQRNEQNPLDCDAVIVDELSMVDAQLFEGLLRALKAGCRLIMVGDSDQLPSVGPGNVLQDLIASDKLPVVRLTEIFRQAMESLIVKNAHEIVSGRMPELRAVDSDFFFIRRTEPESAQDTVADLYCRRLPAAYGYDPLSQIQILCPSRKHILGTEALSKLMQSRLNPPGPGKKELRRPGFILREGDKVIQTRNNYDIEWSRPGEEGAGIFNGDIGILEKIDHAASALWVRFEDRVALYTGEQISDLELAYAMTIHKSQGSEFDCVILPLLSIVPQLAYRNLLYTAVTRAKKQLIIVGSERDVRRMVENNRRTLRYTGLPVLLTEAML